MKFGYTLLYVENVERTIEFYSRAFGLKKGFVHESKAYGEMDTGLTKLGFVQHSLAETHGFKYKKQSPEVPSPSFELGLITDDVAAAYEQAINEGAVKVLPPEDKPWGQKVSYVKDCNGFLIEICSPVKNGSI